MKISYNWIKELVACDVPVEQLVATLTSIGIEVASVQTIAIPKGIIVARIQETKKHPNADKLTLCTVDVAGSEPLAIVCGAPNVVTGMTVPLATIGTKISDDFTISKAKIRGVESFGMLCSERELGLSDNHDGILSLPSQYTLGVALGEYIPDDAVIEVELTANRGDCLSVLGIAREIAAALKKELEIPALMPQQSGEPVSEAITVSIEDEQRCPRYTGRLIKGVTIKQSPEWLKQRLARVGQRSINNIVDITNYINLLFGQPLHAFDYQTIACRKIIVKKALSGQKFITLDGIERTLHEEDLLICDGEKPTAIGGVMGGLHSGISETTTDVFLECAFFDPVTVRKTSKRLDLSTDASYRFERGVDREQGLIDALNTATALMQQLGGGTVASGMIDVYPKHFVPRQIRLRVAQVKRILGIEISPSTIIEILTSLQMTCTQESPQSLLCSIPSFRHDCTQEIDLIEEIGRMHGYDSIPASLTASLQLQPQSRDTEQVYTKLRATCAGLGFNETVTASMISKAMCEILTPAIPAVKLANPLTPELSHLRPTLAASLLNVIVHNNNRKNKNNRLFELSRTFCSSGCGSMPIEKQILAIAMEGDFIPKSWNSEAIPVTFYIFKGIVESVLSSIGITGLSMQKVIQPAESLYTHEAAEVSHRLLQGHFGRLRPAILKVFDLKTAVFYGEIDLTQLVQTARATPVYTELARFPAVERDFAFVMKEEMQAATVASHIVSVSNLVRSVEPFDVYQGEKIQQGYKSIAFSVRLASNERTLTDADADTVSRAIIETVKQKFGITLRQQ
ncbi:MAG: phenylalanine--tRNA ligase subunit beta [Chitinivibrionales bacterium]|nr:phenylalanine--tRNA ligase subunit beta [Chitinivibrionales bacterium]